MSKRILQYLIIFTFTAVANLSASEIFELPHTPSKISGDGYVVTGTANFDAPYYSEMPWRWSEESGLNLLIGSCEDVTDFGSMDINFDGSVIVGWENYDPQGSMFCYTYSSFLWQRDQGYSGLYDIPFGENFGSSGMGISADGTKMVGGYDFAYVEPAACGPWGWGNWYIKDLILDSWVSVPLPDGIDMIDDAEISADGSTLVLDLTQKGNNDEWLSGAPFVYKWNATDGYQYISEGGAAAVSPDGSIIVGRSGGQAFRHSMDSGMEYLGDFSPAAANADCSIIVGNTGDWGTINGLQSMVWDETNGLQTIEEYFLSRGIDLTSEGWIIRYVSDISDDGRAMIGKGSRGGVVKGWMATADVVVTDNSDALFSTVGNWKRSDKATGFYNNDYAYALGGDGASVATFTFEIPAAGNYKISAQWPAHDTRAFDAPFRLINNGTVIDTIRVDQKVNGGQFNPLTGPEAVGTGIYRLDAGVLQVTLSNDANGKVAADAVRVTSLVGFNLAPESRINSPVNATTNIATGDALYFSGTGSDPEDGNSNLTYLWRFGDGSGIGDSTDEDPGPVQFNEPGVFTVTFTVYDSEGRADRTPARVIVNVGTNPDESIVDNANDRFSTAGPWSVSDKAVGFYGPDYAYALSGDGSSVATFTIDIPAAGNYEIFAQWPAHDSRATDAPFRIINNESLVDTVRVDQTTDGGQFNPLTGPASAGAGIYALNAGVLQVTLANDADGKVAADAVRVVSLEDLNAYSTVPKKISSGITGLISFPENYKNSGLQLIGKNGDDTSLSWEWSYMNFGSVANGKFNGIQNLAHPSYPGYVGPSNYLVIHKGRGGTSGSYPEAILCIVVDGEPFQIRLPTFAFENKACNLSLYVADDGSTFWAHHSNGPNHNNTGSGNQNIENSLTLSPSQAFSPEHLAADNNPVDIVVADNGDDRFSKVGAWSISDKAAGFYGSDYAYALSGDGASVATFTFDIPYTGYYEVFAQWPAHNTRASDAPFRLINNGEAVDTIRVDQRTDGGHFNPLTGPEAVGRGIYHLNFGTLQVTLANDANGKVAADAVRIAGWMDN